MSVNNKSTNRLHRKQTCICVEWKKKDRNQKFNLTRDSRVIYQWWSWSLRERPTLGWGRRCWARHGTSWWSLRLWTSCASSPAGPWETHYWGASTAVRWMCSGSCDNMTVRKEDTNFLFQSAPNIPSHKLNIIITLN